MLQTLVHWLKCHSRRSDSNRLVGQGDRSPISLGVSVKRFCWTTIQNILSKYFIDDMRTRLIYLSDSDDVWIRFLITLTDSFLILILQWNADSVVVFPFMFALFLYKKIYLRLLCLVYLHFRDWYYLLFFFCLIQIKRHYDVHL